MRTIISITEKRHFLKWFLDQFEFINYECMYLLQYISKTKSLLSNIHFVDDVTLCPRAMIISIEDKDEKEHSFVYRKKQIYTNEPEKAFHDIRIDREEPLYCQINFENRHRQVEYAAVIEENPYYQPDVSLEFGNEAQELLDNLTFTYKKSKLYQEINNALDEGNQKKFKRLTHSLKALLKDTN